MDRLFVDTNVMLDLLAHREPFYDSALRLFSLAYQGKCEIVVASLSYATCAYILGKCVKPEKLKELLRDFSTIVEISAIDETIIRESIDQCCEFDDIEDAMQHYSALHSSCNIIITRNIKDFSHSKLPVMLPNEYLGQKEL